ncbi:MAG: site-specific DNA-methyltransferase [Prevotella sp.]|nr:site-specific DNA-methyltransferase [Prevotella sp.]
MCNIELNRIYNEDCLQTLSRIEDDAIDLIVTSPPYNKSYYNTGADKRVWSGRNIDYDKFNDAMNPKDYEEWQRNVLSECLRVLKPSGSIFYNHKDILHKQQTIHPTWVYDFPLKQVIIWDRKSSCTIDTHYFMPANEWVFWIVKDKDKTYFDKSKAIYRTNIWQMNTEKNSHPAPFPMKFSNNCVLTCCPENGITYDPFMGSGTTAMSVLRIGGGRKYIGSEISEKYVEMSEKRIREENMQLSLF